MDRGLDVPMVKDILIKNVIAFSSESSPLDAIRGFNKYKISSAPVINDKQEVIGFLSESDTIRCISNCLFYDEKRNPLVETIMSKEIFKANPEWDVFELENFFVSKHIRTAPVVDSENHLVGIVTRRDALHALEKVLHVREEYKKEIKTPVELNLQDKLKMAIKSIEEN